MTSSQTLTPPRPPGLSPVLYPYGDSVDPSCRLSRISPFPTSLSPTSRNLSRKSCALVGLLLWLMLEADHPRCGSQLPCPITRPDPPTPLRSTARTRDRHARKVRTKKSTTLQVLQDPRPRLCACLHAPHSLVIRIRIQESHESPAGTSDTDTHHRRLSASSVPSARFYARRRRTSSDGSVRVLDSGSWTPSAPLMERGRGGCLRLIGPSCVLLGQPRARR